MKSTNYYFVCLFVVFITLSGCATGPLNEPGPEQDANKTARLNLELGLAYMEQKDYKRAMNRLQKSIKADPQYSDAHNAMAVLYARLGKDEKADAHYKKAIRLAPENSGALNNYGQFLCTHGQREKADALFKKALANPLYETPQYANLNAGICAKDNNDFEQAEIYFRAALKQDPYFAPALYQMADLSYSQKQYLPARGYLERFAETARHSARSLWLAVRVEKALGDRDAEASYALRLKNNFPDSQETRLLLKMESQ